MISTMKTIKKDLLKISRIIAVTGSVIFLGGCKDNFTSPISSSGTTITQVATGQDSLVAFVAALNKTGLNSNFNNVNGGLFTVFASSNYAFVQYLRAAGIPIAKVDASTAGAAAATAINSLTVTSTPLNISSLVTRLNYHIISSNVPSSLITGGQGFITMQGARLSLSNFAGATYPYEVNANVASSGGGSGANLITTDLKASNGVVHIVDRVMAPITTANIWAPSLLNFSVNYSVSPITVSIGGTVIPLDNSGNHNVANAPTNTSDGDFNLFTAALVRANLAQVIIPNVTLFPDFTVFAPTDGAFKSYLNVTTEAAGITAINALDPTVLAGLINYHIVSGRILSTDLTNAESVTTLAAKAFTINVNGPTYTITDLNSTSADATITGANKLSNAGIVHAVNQVLLPN